MFGVFMGFVPAMLSSNWGRHQALSWINRSIPGKVDIQTMDLNWFGGQTIVGMNLKDPEGNIIFTVDKLTTDASLWQILKKKPEGSLQITELNGKIETNTEGQSNLQQALGINIDHSIPNSNPSSIDLSHVNILVSDHPFFARLKGFTTQDSLKGSFDINLSLNQSENPDWLKLKDFADKYFTLEGSKEAKIQARIENFPIDLLDRIAALKNPSLNGLFRSILGDRLNIHLDNNPTDEGAAFKLNLKAPNAEGNANGIIKKEIIALQEPATFHINLLPEAINPFITQYFELANPSKMEITFSDVSIPIAFFEKDGQAEPCL